MAPSKTRVGSRELKTRLGTYLRQVRNGATIVVTDRGEPVAELRPLPTGEGGLDEKLRALIARGVLAGPVDGPRQLASVDPVPVDGETLSKGILHARGDRF